MQATPRNRPGQGTPSRGLASQTTITIMVIIILTVMAWILAPGESPAPDEVAAPDSANTVSRTAASAPDSPPSGPRGRQTPDAPDIPYPTALTSDELTLAPVAEPDAAETSPEAALKQPAEPGPPPEEPAEAAPTPTPAVADATAGAEATGAAAAPALTLENSDAAVREQLSRVADPAGYVSGVLASTNLIQRGAAAIDSVRRGLVPDRLLNLKRPSGTFAVRSNASGQTVVDPSSYRRYDPLVNALLSATPSTLARAFHRFRDLLEQAYGELGYKPEDMDNALIAALDQVLATPVVEGEIALTRYEAVWRYADETLEQRSLLHKQLMRTGPDNLRRIKAWASALREALLRP